MNSKCNEIQGIGTLERSRLSELLRGCRGSISISEGVNLLKMPRNSVARMLSKYAKKGWLTRIAPGIYLPVPLESATADIVAEDMLSLSEKLFAPCYLSGWTAAEYWGFTEQIFQSIVVITQRKQKNYHPIIQGTSYQLYLASNARFFGLKTIWRGNIPVKIADPSRLLIDLMYRPEMAGGIRSVADFFSSYLTSDKRNITALSDYLVQFDSGVACKRLGFLAEKLCPDEAKLIELCLKGISKGSSKLDPTLVCTKYVTRWNLTIPQSWLKEGPND